MKNRSTFKYLAMCSTCLFPVAAAAQGFDIGDAPAAPAPVPTYTSVVEGGIGFQSDDSFRFGRYTGLDDEGLFFIGNASILRRAAYDSGDPSYWTLDANNVGIDSRSLRAEYGRQGSYKAFVGYDQIPSLRFNDTVTPYSGAGSGSLTLPPGWDPNGGLAANIDRRNQALMPLLVSSLKDVDIEQERKRYGAGLSMALGNGFSFSASTRRETKEGLKTLGGAFGSTGGNPQSIILAEPVDYQTDEFKAALSFTRSRLQAELSYNLSIFENEIDALRFDNPYDGPLAGTWPVQGAPFNAAAPTFGQFALAPDNTAHQVSLTGGYDISPTTRISANLGYGWHLQDEAFLPYTTNAALLTAVPALPRSSLDGEIINTLAAVQLSTRPMERMDVRASYRYYDRDNNSPQNEYNRVAGDVGLGNIRINHPYSFTEHLAKLGAGYRIASKTRLTADYDYRIFERTHSEVDENTEHTGKARLTHSFGSAVTASAGYTYADRTGSDYVGNRPFLEGISAAQRAAILAAPGAEGENLWENHPSLRKYFEADRVRHAGTASLNFFPSDQLNIGLTGTVGTDEYKNSELGLTDATTYSGTVDLSYAPRAGVNTYAFYTYDQFKSDQASRTFSGGAVKAAQWDDPSRNWWLETKDAAHTIGAGVSYDITEKLTLGGEYVMSMANTQFDMSAGTAIAVGAFASPPDVDSRLHSLSLSAEYKLQQNLALRLGYIYERYKSSDWQIDNFGPTTTAGLIGLGEQSPDYDVHLVGVTARYRF